jgi:hypothetical protein
MSASFQPESIIDLTSSSDDDDDDDVHALTQGGGGVNPDAVQEDSGHIISPQSALKLSDLASKFGVDAGAWDVLKSKVFVRILQKPNKKEGSLVEEKVFKCSWLKNPLRSLLQLKKELQVVQRQTDDNLVLSPVVHQVDWRTTEFVDTFFSLEEIELMVEPRKRPTVTWTVTDESHKKTFKSYQNMLSVLKLFIERPEAEVATADEAEDEVKKKKTAILFATMAAKAEKAAKVPILVLQEQIKRWREEGKPNDRVHSEIKKQAQTLLAQDWGHVLGIDVETFLKNDSLHVNKILGKKIDVMINPSGPNLTHIMENIFTHADFLGRDGTRSKVQANDINTTNESQTYAELSYPCIENIVKYLVTREHMTAESSILDIGSGSGRFVMCVQALFPEALALAHGVEIAQHRYEASTLLLEKAKLLVPNELFKNVRFFHDNVRDFSEPNGGLYTHVYLFDKVFRADTFPHIAGFLERNKTQYLISTRTQKTWMEAYEDYSYVEGSEDGGSLNIRWLESFQSNKSKLYNASQKIHIYQIRW